jgi:hypothetical protein
MVVAVRKYRSDVARRVLETWGCSAREVAPGVLAEDCSGQNPLSNIARSSAFIPVDFQIGPAAWPQRDMRHKTYFAQSFDSR